MVNQRSLFEEQQEIIPNQMGFFSIPQNINLSSSLGTNCHQSLIKAFTSIPNNTSFAPDPINIIANLSETLIPSSSGSAKQREESINSVHLGGTSSQLLFLQRSVANPWALGESSESFGCSKRTDGNVECEHNQLLGVSAMKMKKIKARRKVRDPRFCFKTLSDVDVLDDGYRWRKYGQKVVKNTQHPRSYYRCTQDNCRVKKRVERLAEDPRMVITTYEGRHVHSPSNDQEDSQTHPLLTNFFW